MWFIILHSITGRNFKRIWLHLVGYGQKNTQKQPKSWNLKDIWKLGNYISDIKCKIYMIYDQIRTNLNTFCLQKMRLSIRGEGERREGILKLLVKISLRFERPFGDLLHINPQKIWPNWYGNLLIITSPSTSSYSFSLSFSGHWSLLPSQKPSKNGSVNSIFGSIEIKKIL